MFGHFARITRLLLLVSYKQDKVASTYLSVKSKVDYSAFGSEIELSKSTSYYSSADFQPKFGVVTMVLKFNDQYN